MNVRQDFDTTPATASHAHETRRSCNAPVRPDEYSATPSSSTSLIGMIMGIVGIFFAPCFGFSIAALVLGFKGRKREPEARGFWLTALTTGWIGLSVGLIVASIFVVAIIVAMNNPGGTTTRL